MCAIIENTHNCTVNPMYNLLVVLIKGCICLVYESSPTTLLSSYTFSIEDSGGSSAEHKGHVPPLSGSRSGCGLEQQLNYCSMQNAE